VNGNSACAKEERLGCQETWTSMGSKRLVLINRDEERALISSYQKDKNPVALKRLVNAHMRLVVMLANRYKTSFRDVGDLVQEGAIGLVRAIEKFDLERDIKLSTYAGWWIRACISRYSLKNRNMVNIATTADRRKLIESLGKAEKILVAAGKDITCRALAEHFGAKLGDVEAIRQLRAGRQEVSMSAQATDHNGDEFEVPWMASDCVPQDELLETSRRDAKLAMCLTGFVPTLCARESFIFENRWMTDDPMTLDEIGRHFGLTRERIRQVEKRIFDRLRAYLADEMPWYFETGGQHVFR